MAWSLSKQILKKILGHSKKYLFEKKILKLPPSDFIVPEQWHLISLHQNNAIPLAAMDPLPLNIDRFLIEGRWIPWLCADMVWLHLHSRKCYLFELGTCLSKSLDKNTKFYGPDDRAGQEEEYSCVIREDCSRFFCISSYFEFPEGDIFARRGCRI